jgi:hypothetical protein
VIARIAVLAVMVLGLGSAGASPPSVSLLRSVAEDESGPPADDGPGLTDCNGALQTGPSLDDPNVDTDPERPITEHASHVTREGEEDGDDQSDNDADGQCRSETLELWHQEDPDAMVHVMLETGRAHS